MYHYLPHYQQILLFLAVVWGYNYPVSAQQQLASAQPIFINNSQDETLSLTQALEQIKNQHQVTFGYQEDLVQGKQVKETTWRNKDLPEALHQLLSPHGLDFKQLDDIHYIINRRERTDPIRLQIQPIVEPPTKSTLPRSGTLNQTLSTSLADQYAYEKTVSGQVIDESTNTPIPGANILAKNTTTGTVTDIEGNYRLTVGDAVTTLIFSSIGYETREETISGRTVINVSMAPDIQSLSEVVVIGYGTVDKSDLSGSVASVEGEDLQMTPANTFVQSLQGRAPGVDVRAASNAPGGGIRIRIRGTNSINASSDPLYVVDGFPIDNNAQVNPSGAGNNAFGADPLSSISPNDIESIEILKDASATAIYGARGANGVVIITTKRGQIGKPKIDFDYFLRVDNVRNKLDLANAQELAILNNEWAANNGRDPIYDGVNRPLPEELGEGTDWQDEIFRTALVHSYNLSISGGTENTRYLVSGNYFDQDGIIIESNFKRGGLKFNLDQKISERLSFGVNLNATRTVNDAVPSDGSGFQNDSPLWNALTTTPVIPVVDEEGNYVHNHDETVKILENPVFNCPHPLRHHLRHPGDRQHLYGFRSGRRTYFSGQLRS